MSEEAELLANLVSGSQIAFEEIVRRHQFAVRWQICRQVREAQVADDLAQDVFLELARVKDRSDWQAPQSIRAWLLTVARNKAVDHVRSQNRQSSMRWRTGHAALDAIAEHRKTATEEVDQEFRDRQLLALEHCLSRLQTQHRELVDEFYAQAKSSELIGARLGKGPGAVRMMLLRIRHALGKCIQNQMEQS